MSLFYKIWANPQTTIHEVVKYLLQMADGKSTTWSAHPRLLAIQYNLPDPLALLHREAWKKSRWTILTKTRITIFHEKQLREQALENSKMRYLNVELQGLSGAPHQAILNIFTTQDALKLRYHIKFLSGDYLTAERITKKLGNMSNHVPTCWTMYLRYKPEC